MALRLGAYTACLHDRPLEAALEVLRSSGLTSVEVNTGGFIPSPHCHVDLLLSSAQARRDYLEVFASRGMELTGLNCNGNPLPGVGPEHADDLRRTIELAGLLGVPNVVSMSGTPGSDPDAKYPSWVLARGAPVTAAPPVPDWYCMAAAAMMLELHERGNHVV
jgi:sugar phosphate isomerase/epimerase